MLKQLFVAGAMMVAANAAMAGTYLPEPSLVPLFLLPSMREGHDARRYDDDRHDRGRHRGHYKRKHDRRERVAEAPVPVLPVPPLPRLPPPPIPPGLPRPPGL